MKTCIRYLVFLIFSIPFGCLNGQNNALNFDGFDDYITLTPINGFPSTPTSNFSVEINFISNAQSMGSCNNNYKRLFALGNLSNSTLFEMGECNGFLIVSWMTSTNNMGLLSMNTTIRDNMWHCLSAVRSTNALEIYLDGVFVPQLSSTTIAGDHDIDYFIVGHALTAVGSQTPGEDWEGDIDEVKLWSNALSASELTACSKCQLPKITPGLAVYWQFDEGIAGMMNPNAMAMDHSANLNTGILHGFSLAGIISNYVPSGTSIIYPNNSNLHIQISDPSTLNPITGVCDGDPIHLSLKNANNNVPTAFPGVMVNWEYRDLPNPPMIGWIPTVLTGYQFATSPPNTFTDINCTGSTTGYVDREYRAIITATTPLGMCTYEITSSPLHISCNVTNAAITINPTGSICDGDISSVSVNLTSTDLFIPGSTTISWFVNGNPQPQGNVVNFNYTLPPSSSTQTNLCFTAVVTNSTCPPFTVQNCFRIDPKPVCGTIIGGANLMLIGLTPHLIYEICPGDDATLAIAQPNLFANCNPQWEYSFNPFALMPIWVQMGFSNSLQNTNILPSYLWSTNTAIYYRIKCISPYPNSACPPCISDIIEVRLKTPPPIPVIISSPANPNFCNGSSVTLTASNTSLNPTWFCNGDNIGPGSSKIASKTACYWIEVNDLCYTVKSLPYCVKECTAVALIKCPDDNPCMIPGVPITISGTLSSSTCGIIVQYDWKVTDLSTGLMHNFNTPNITFIPDPNGSLVSLTVTDAFGCTHTTQSIFTPCQP